MTRQVLFTPQRATEDDAIANASPGATAEFFITGTTTPILIEDVAGNPLANPVASNAAGVFPQVVYLGADQVKCVIKDADGGTLYTVDPCPLFDAAGSAADAVSYSPNSLIAETNVQDAIDAISDIISGSSGSVLFADGTDADPSISFASDPDTGFYRSGGNEIGVATGGASRARFGNLGVFMEINGTAADPSLFYRAGANRSGLFSPTAATLGFSSGGAERGRVQGGQLRWGQTTQDEPGNGNVVNGATLNGTGTLFLSASNTAVLGINRNTGDGTAVVFRRQGVGTAVGSIGVTTTNTAYNTTSDYRLKDAVEAPEGWNATNQAKAIAGALRHYTWKSNGLMEFGAFAHELADVAPQAISGEKDAVDEHGNIDPQGVDWSKLVPILAAALGDALARIEQLEGKGE